jgi:hypothetical protein
MRTPTIGLALAFALVAGCHSQSRSVPEPTTRWQRVEGSSEPLENARTACKQEALEKTKSIRQQGVATRAAGGIFIECMRRHGWTQVATDAR